MLFEGGGAAVVFKTGKMLITMLWMTEKTTFADHECHVHD